MKTETYTNRYKEKYEFILDESGDILWKGDFAWSRTSSPNEYGVAFLNYVSDGGTMSLDEFKVEVHKYEKKENGDYEGTDTFMQYGHLVKSDTSKIDMVDPSGGPYISEGQDMGYYFDEFKGMIVEGFEPIEGGFKILIKKHNI